ncbi:MAG: uridine kinase family protein [Spirochaetia bacterium]
MKTQLQALSRPISMLCDHLVKNGVRYVFVAGSSGSGKSVLASRLELELRARGESALMIPLDAFYKSFTEIPDLDKAGSKDWDHPDALNVKKIHEFLHTLSSNGCATLPYYSFELNTPLPDGKVLHVLEKTIFIIEGLHAFNPKVVPIDERANHLKIYVDTLLPQSPEFFDFKLFRTIVRDYELRGRPLAQTLRRWKYAAAALDLWITPLVNTQDPHLRFFNSFTLEEYQSLRPRALTLLIDALLQAKADYMEHTPAESSTLPYLGTIAHLLRICTTLDLST